MEKIKISGVIGLTILQKNNKKIYIFFDDHSNINYCETGIFLPNFLETISVDINTLILLEEPFLERNKQLKILWEDVHHIKLSRNYYDKSIKKCLKDRICLTIPIDIRLNLFIFSLDDVYNNIDNDEYFNDILISIDEYLKYIRFLFGEIELDENKENHNKNIFFIKKIFDNYKKTYYYIQLKNCENNFYNTFIKNKRNLSLKNFIRQNRNITFEFCQGYPFINSNENIFLDQYDKLINAIMEFYTCIVTFIMNKDRTIIYTGFYHGTNLLYILKNIYNFNVIKEYGITENIENHSNASNISNCLLIDKLDFS